MAKKKKTSVLTQIMESIRKKWEVAGIRDIVYIVSYLAAVAFSYKVMMGLQQFIVTINPIRWLTGTMPTKEELEALDMDTLITSFVVAYIILKIDIDDVTGALTKMTLTAGKMGSA